MTRASTTRDVATENRLRKEIAESEYWVDRLSNTPDAMGMMSMDAQRRARENIAYHREKVKRLKAELAAMETPISSTQAGIVSRSSVVRRCAGLRQKIGMTDDPEKKAEYRREIRRLKMQARRADDGHR